MTFPPPPPPPSKRRGSSWLAIGTALVIVLVAVVAIVLIVASAIKPASGKGSPPSTTAECLVRCGAPAPVVAKPNPYVEALDLTWRTTSAADVRSICTAFNDFGFQWVSDTFWSSGNSGTVEDHDAVDAELHRLLNRDC